MLVCNVYKFIRRNRDKPLPPVLQKVNQALSSSSKDAFRINSECDEPPRPPSPTTEPPLEPVLSSKLKKPENLVKPKQLLIRKQPTTEHVKFSSSNSGSSESTCDNALTKQGSGDSISDSNTGIRENIPNNNQLHAKCESATVYPSTKVSLSSELVNSTSTSNIQFTSSNFSVNTNSMAIEKCATQESGNSSVTSKTQEQTEEDSENIKNSNLLKWQLPNSNVSGDDFSDKNETNVEKVEGSNKSTRVHIDIMSSVDQERFSGM